MMDPRNNAELFRTPEDLAAKTNPVSRWLVVGSCFASGFVDFVKSLDDAADGDYIIFNNAANLPDSPPRPIETYDFQFVQLALRSVVPDFSHARLNFEDIAAFEQLFEICQQRLDVLFDSAMSYARSSGILSVVSNFIVPQQGSLGRLVGRRDLRNFAFFVQCLNDRLEEMVAAMPNCHLIDLNEILRTYGAKYLQDDILWQFNHAAALNDNDFELDQARLHVPQPVSAAYTLKIGEFVHAIWKELKALYVTLSGAGAVKLVAVDLDDTLWRGVLAEQDVVNPRALEGWPLGLAEALLYLKQRGIVLAIVSKNDEAKIRGLWDVMWQGRLRLDDFACVKINWRSKAENLAEVIKEVNILPSSVVFIDDNPVERFTIETALPGVRTLGAELYYLRRILLWAPELQTAAITQESARRSEMIKAQIERETLRGAMDRGAFLASLEVRFEEIHIADMAHPRFERAFELLNKTNQFNTTGERWTMDEMARAFAEGLEIFAFEVSDRFTQYGLVGMALVKGGVIEQFVMSCRVIGLDVELEALRRIQARRDALRARFVETSVNFLCKDLFQRAGFVLKDDLWTWVAGFPNDLD